MRCVDIVVTYIIIINQQQLNEWNNRESQLKR